MFDKYIKETFYPESIPKNILYYLILILIISFGIYIRIKYFCQARPLFADEIALAENLIDKNIFKLFLKLDNFQASPPLFTALSYCTIKLFGLSEFTLRIIPLITGVLSVFLFYVFSKKILQKPASVLVANFLFATTVQLIYYSQEFKQYSVEVFIIMLLFLIFSKDNLLELNKKKLFFYGFIIFISLLLSYAAFFAVAGIVIANLLKINKHNKKQTFILASAFLASSFVPLLLAAGKLKDKQPFLDEFAGFNFLQNIAGGNFTYVFPLNMPSYTHIILFILGFILLIRKKTVILNYAFLTLLLAIIASIMSIYPFALRLMIYSIPIIIIIFVKPLDLISLENKKTMAISILVITLFFYAFNGSFRFKSIQDVYNLNINDFILSSRLADYSKKEYRDIDIYKLLSGDFKLGDLILCEGYAHKFLKVYAYYSQDKNYAMNLKNNICFFHLSNLHTISYSSGTYWIFSQSYMFHDDHDKTIRKIKGIIPESIKIYQSPSLILYKFVVKKN